MNARIKAVTIWSALCAACIFAGAIALTGQLARTQMTDPVPPPERVSVRSDGGQANGNSSGAVTSGDGTCVAFYSEATNLLPQAGPDVDTNAVRDVFLFDRSTRELQRVSVASDGAQGDGPSQAQGFRPDIDEDCSCVAFSSDAANFVPDDTNGSTDVFVRDLSEEPPTTLRASVGDGAEANGASSFPSVSADCQIIAFHSTASNLVPDDTNGASDVFVYNRATGLTTRVSVGVGGEQANGFSITPAISADGRCVAFTSLAANFLPGDTNGTLDVYVACDGEVTCRASVDSAGNGANGMSLLPALSTDGRIVAFKSEASNLVADDRNDTVDVFVHDCETGETERVSVNSRGEEGDDISIPPSVSGDGRFVAFGSFASNLLPGQTTRGRAQVYVHDRQHGTTVLVSSTAAGRPGGGSVPDLPPSISLDGEVVAFASLASDLVAGDSNEVLDAFVRANATVAPTNTPTATREPTRTPTEIIPCKIDEDCQVGEVCEEEICVPAPTPTPTIACTTGDDCPPGLICDEGVCRDISTPTVTATPLPTCVTDEDCPEGDRCRAMVCVPPRQCDDEDPEIDRAACRGVRETCLDDTCECGGDCNLNGLVFGTEITKMVCIFGSECELSVCPAGDINGDGEVTGTDITLAVLNLGLGCPGEGTPLIFAQDRTDETRTIEIGSASGIPGELIDLDIRMIGGDEVTTSHVDIIIDNSVLEVSQTDPPCVIDPRLRGTWEAEVKLPQRPPPSPGYTRLRVAVIDKVPPRDWFGPGPILSCRFRIQPDAALGSSTDLVGDPMRLEIGDFNGQPFDARVADGSVTVSDEQPPCTDDGECPEGTHCRDRVCKPIIECSGPDGGPDECREGREACIEDVCECAADCNRDGVVRSNEVTILLNIIDGLALLDSCLAADVNGDGVVRSNEVTFALINIDEGCP